jgi:hypothetical protein
VVGPGRRRCLFARTRHALALPALLVGALACSGPALAPPAPAAPGAAPLAPGAAPAAPALASLSQRVLLFPLNVVGVPLPSEVEAGADAVASELRATLEGRGLAVEALGLGAARDAWLRAAVAHKDEAGAEKMSLEGAASVLARQLSEAYDFDALLLPWVVMQAAKLKGGEVEWDGVERKVDFYPLGKAKRARWVLGRLKLWVKVPSLRVLGFSPEGEKLFDGVGGLDLVEEAELDVSASKMSFNMVPKDEIFEDRARLREGIAIALAPFLPPPAEAAE